MTPIPPDTLRELVREVLEAVLRERGYGGLPPPPADPPRPASSSIPSARSQSQGPPPPRVLILLTGGGIDLEILRLALQTLARAAFLDLLIAPDFLQRYGPWDPALSPSAAQITEYKDLVEGVGRLAMARALVLPCLSRGTAARVSLGIDDDLPSILLGRALRKGIPVVACLSDADPDTLRAVPALTQGPNSLRHLLETYVRRLTAWGIRWVATERLPEAVFQSLQPALRFSAPPHVASPPDTGPLSSSGPVRPPGPPSAGGSIAASSQRRRFFTREDIWILLERGESELRIGPRDILTPEAEDFARSRGIRLVRTEAGS